MPLVFYNIWIWTCLLYTSDAAEERVIQQKVNERLDGWLKQISGEQRDGIEDCIDDMLEENWACQLYLYEEGVKDGIRLMKMIYGL